MRYTHEEVKMSLCLSKKKLLLCSAVVATLVFIILLYQSDKLGAMEESYKICRINEKTLSAQLQGNHFPVIGFTLTSITVTISVWT